MRTVFRVFARDTTRAPARGVAYSYPWLIALVSVALAVTPNQAMAQGFDVPDRGYVIAGAAIFIAQLLLIVGLLIERRSRRNTERELRTSKERYQSVVDAQTELVCRCRPDSTLTFVNHAYCRFWNKSREELLGRKFIELIPEPARAEVLERIGRIVSGTASHEHRVTLADGSVGWQHWINRAILDERGRLIELQGVGRDITDRKRAEEAVGQLEARNSAILRAIPDLMFVLLRDGTYVDYYARDPKRLFLPPERFIGRSVRDVFPEAAADLLMDAIERVFESQDPVIVEYELDMEERHHFEARIVRAAPDSVLTIVRDVTEAKRSLELNRDLAGRLIASQEMERTRIARDIHDGICQDIAALSVDIGYLRRTGGDIQSPEAQETLLSVERRTATVAENLRLLSHGLHPSVLHHVGLVAALQAHCVEVERQYPVQVRFFASDDVEPASRLVALALFRIAQEALRNAVRHGHARHGTVSLTRGTRHLNLAVADDGRGFDLAIARRKDGLGLLSIEERARLLQGEATIRSEPGRGTTIEVRVPVAVAERASDKPERLPRQQRPSKHHLDFK